MNDKTPKKALIFGLGQTGFSCVRHLTQQGNDIIAFDTRLAPPFLERVRRDYPQVVVHLGEFNSAILDGVNQVVVSPGVSLQTAGLELAKKMGIDIIGDVQMFSELALAPIVAITGSNGKSTTTSLVGEMFERAGYQIKLGGNIGVPVLDLLDQEIPDYYVLELSSFQLETALNLPLKIAVILNISEDHMDRYDDLDEYAKSKMTIYRHAEYKLTNLDDQWLDQRLMRKLTRKDSSKTIGFTSQRPKTNEYGLTSVDGEQWVALGETLIFNASELKLQGRHQLMNVMVALVIGDICSLPRKIMCQVFREFDGLAHRTQFVAEINHVTYINDSKGTNIGATVAAVSGMERPVVLIAGGESKGADFSNLALKFDGKVRHMILIGKAAGIIENEVKGSIPTIRALSLSAAVQRAADLAHAGDCVLLSPACASFDMFDNYQERGNVFMNAVKELS